MWKAFLVRPPPSSRRPRLKCSHSSAISPLRAETQSLPSTETEEGSLEFNGQFQTLCLAAAFSRCQRSGQSRVCHVVSSNRYPTLSVSLWIVPGNGSKLNQSLSATSIGDGKKYLMPTPTGERQGHKWGCRPPYGICISSSIRS